MSNVKSHVTEINRILKKGKTSPMLRQALIAIVGALNQGNLKLAYQLSACKSFITGVLNPKDKVHAFQENNAYNEKTLGRDVYSILDGIHHYLAMDVNQIPSGMMIMSAGGSAEMHIKGTHPIIKRILSERRAIYAKG